jgi:periplasmic protein TonB
MTTVIKNSFFVIAAITAGLLMGSCNNGEDSNSDNTSTLQQPADPATAVADNTKIDKPVAKIKKGKASVVINKANGMKVTKDKDGIYTNAEVMPQYPGGEAALSTFVEKNIDYPQHAVDANTEGTVNVSFVIDEKGKVVKPVTQGNTVGNGIEDEAVKIVSKLPDWKPGTVKGKPVKTRLTLPITFKLADS